ncbi:unnamed protein product [Tenebrio molitor]|nr:unnamed protein product [Tenebrio molitor]
MFIRVVTAITIYQLYLAVVCACFRKNVCKNLNDYRTIKDNRNCWYNPDVGSTPRKIIERYGYPFENHQLVTPDGYILNMYRVPHNGSDPYRKRPPIFLQHGFASDSSTWLMLGQQSSVFFFANNGYDVWVSNLRGTEYSPKHVKYTVYDPPYWNFSFHEMGIYDVPTMLDYIAKMTNQKIYYIGHSMGTTVSFIYASLFPEKAKRNLKSIVSLAPIAYMGNVTSVVKAFVPLRNDIWDFFVSIGLYGIGTNIQDKLDAVHKICTQYPFILICADLAGLYVGDNDYETEPSELPVIQSFFPSGFSVKTLLHFAQEMAVQERFQFFDYGPQYNLHFYNSETVPEYPISRINIPVHLFYGKNDRLATEKDVFYLYNKLKTKKTILEVFNFSHVNFAAARHSLELFKIILKFLR